MFRMRVCKLVLRFYIKAVLSGIDPMYIYKIMEVDVCKAICISL